MLNKTQPFYTSTTFAVKINTMKKLIKAIPFLFAVNGFLSVGHSEEKTSANHCMESLAAEASTQAKTRVKEAEERYASEQTKTIEPVDVFALEPYTEKDVEEAVKQVKAEMEKGYSWKMAILFLKTELKWSEVLTLKVLAQIVVQTKQGFSKYAYRPLYDAQAEIRRIIGPIWRDTFKMGAMDLIAEKEAYGERLRRLGKDEESLSSGNPKGRARSVSKRGPANPEAVRAIAKHIRKVGRPLILDDGMVKEVKQIELSPGFNQSGMSHPQTSAEALLSMLYVHVGMAKSGVRYTYNTGEGGANLALAILNKNIDVKDFVSEYVNYARLTSGKQKFGKFKMATEEVQGERIFKLRDKLFAEFTQEDMNRAQIMVQIGPDLNGARTEDNKIDLAIIKKLSENPAVAGFQIKISQAAKKQAKVDGSKMGAIAAWVRKLVRGKEVHSTGTTVEWDTDEHLGETILALKLIGGKPVSVKFAVGQTDQVYDSMAFLKSINAIPDMIQLDGGAKDHGPGSGNTRVESDTNHNISTAVRLMDVILKDLGIRDQIYLEASGDVTFTHDALVLMSLGADGVAVARLMLTFIGCNKIKKCAGGKCLTGVTARDNTIMAYGLDPLEHGPRALQASKYWVSELWNFIVESEVTNLDVPYRLQNAYMGPNQRLTIQGDNEAELLYKVFPVYHIAYLLQNRIPLERLRTHLGLAPQLTNIERLMAFELNMRDQDYYEPSDLFELMVNE